MGSTCLRGGWGKALRSSSTSRTASGAGVTLGGTGLSMIGPACSVSRAGRVASAPAHNPTHIVTGLVLDLWHAVLRLPAGPNVCMILSSPGCRLGTQQRAAFAMLATLQSPCKVVEGHAEHSTLDVYDLGKCTRPSVPCWWIRSPAEVGSRRSRGMHSSGKLAATWGTGEHAPAAAEGGRGS